MNIIVALAYVPSADVVPTFQLLHKQEDLPFLLQPLLNYFEKTYVTGVAPRGRRRAEQSRYPIKL